VVDGVSANGWGPSALTGYDDSRGLSVIVAQQPTETLPTHHLTRSAAYPHVRLDQLIVKPLMIALGMVMAQVLMQSRTQ
jgi:hypothetical protein